jgi:hypothetical protein
MFSHTQKMRKKKEIKLLVFVLFNINGRNIPVRQHSEFLLPYLLSSKKQLMLHVVGPLQLPVPLLC